MTPDFSQLLNPAAARDAFVASSQQLMAYQKQLVTWQLDQARAGLAHAATVESQLKDMIESSVAHGLDNSQRAFEQVAVFEDVVIGGFSQPKSDSADTASS